MHHHELAPALNPPTQSAAAKITSAQNLALAVAPSDSSDAPVRRFAVSGVDLSVARQAYQDAYGGTRFSVTPSDDAFSFRYAYVGDDRVTLRTSTTTGHVSGEIPHLRDYVVSWFKAGTGEVRLGDTPGVGRSATPFLLPAERRFDFAFAPHKQNLIHFAPDFLEDIASEFHSGRTQAVSFDHDALPAPDAIARWRAAVSAATAVLIDIAATPLLRMNAQLPLARALLQLFPWFGLDVPQILRQPPLARTRIALEFFQHHAHEPITPADAARAAGLHTRTLQQQMRRHLEMSPSAYLRSIRLDRARRDLTAATPDSATVASIAGAWGFGHLGRFSSAYQIRFRERPSDTLRR